MARWSCPYVVAGGGLAGLAAALPLGERALVLEAADRPGGLVRAHRVGDYWFDTVLHLLHVPDEALLGRLRDLLGDVLAPLDRTAWVEMPFGRVRYPFQQNLAALPLDLAVDCLHDMAAAIRQAAGHRTGADASLGRRLRDSFGATMCAIFFEPYNEKVWKRSLDELPADAMAWTIPGPDFRQVLRGALSDQPDDRSYNSNGWYPRPPADAPVRGMETLTRALAQRVRRIECGAAIRSVNLAERSVAVDGPAGPVTCRWEKGLVSTIPLPRLAEMTVGLPGVLRDAARGLDWMRAVYLAYCVEGPRPMDRGHWHYYPDPAVVYNRLVYTHRFDPLLAPPGGWGLMAEVTERRDASAPDRAALLRRGADDLAAAGAIPPDCRIVDATTFDTEFAYVVFDDARAEAVSRLAAHYAEHGVTLLGRYGRWDYLSMSQVLRESETWGRRVAEAHGWEVHE